LADTWQVPPIREFFVSVRKSHLAMGSADIKTLELNTSLQKISVLKAFSSALYRYYTTNSYELQYLSDIFPLFSKNILCEK